MENIMQNQEVIRIRQKHKTKVILIKILQYFLLATISIFFLFPFIVMVCYSVLPDKEALNGVLFSREHIVNLGTYIQVLSSAKYLKYILNSVTVGIIAAFGIPLSASLCAYGFSKLKFRGRKLVFSIVLGTMMLPSIVTQVPLYSVYMKLNWNNTLIPMWLPGILGGGATNIFLMTQFMKGIPNDLANAARIDGAGDFRIFIQMIVPLCIPVFLFVMVSSFIGSWNDFVTPLLYISDISKYTLSLGVYKDYGGAVTINNLPNLSMAAGVIMMLPCLILFFIFQRYLIDGVTITGLKG